MAGHDRKLYLKVFFALAVLTAIEIAIPLMANKYGYTPAQKEAATARTSGGSQLFFAFTPHWSSSALYLLSIAKAGLVALVFMHLKFETKWLKFIALLPATAALYALMLCAEGFYRHFLEVSNVAEPVVRAAAGH
jgi:cytochrome c oxidase subunit IV